jgi:hypothetical protein
MTDKIHNTYTSSLDSKIAAEAKTALAKLPPEATQGAEAARATLYDWLIGLDGQITKPAQNISPEMMSAAVDAMKPYLDEAKSKEAAQAVLSAVLKTGFLSPVLMSRQSKDHPWEQTGLFSDGNLQTVFAKVGKAPYQPIGHEDGKRYIPRESSNLFWIRDFALMLPKAMPGAFIVAKTADDPKAYAPARLSEKELAIIEESTTVINEELDNLRKADKDSKAEREFVLRETIKLARVQLPKLDLRMSTEADKRPELGALFEHVDAEALATVVLEYLNIQLDEHKAREGVTQTTLVSKDPKETLANMRKTLHAEITAIMGTTPVDENNLASCVTRAAMGLPEVRALVDGVKGDTPILDVAPKVLELLAR